MTNKSNLARNVLEPRIDPVSKKMDVGGLFIKPTNLITALLYGFAQHDRPMAKEYYFWRICDELWNNDDLPEKLMVRHPWADRMIKNAIRNKYLAVGGSASSGKSHTMAAWGLVNFLSQPQNTLILVTSTTLREARKRIWGSIISLLTVVEDAPIKIRDSIGNIAYINEKGDLIEKAAKSSRQSGWQGHFKSIHITKVHSPNISVQLFAAARPIFVTVNGTGNIVVFSNTGAYVAGAVSATGNITGNYILPG